VKRSGPTGDRKSTLWAYHSHIHETDIYKGLIGPIVVYAPGAFPDASQNEIFVKSLLDKPKDNVELFPINGFIYGNLPLINTYIGQEVTWYLLSFGNEEDIHAMHWHGNVVKDVSNNYVDVVTLFPASFQTVVMMPDAIGKWMYHCHVVEHFQMGMFSYYTVS